MILHIFFKKIFNNKWATKIEINLGNINLGAGPEYSTSLTKVGNKYSTSLTNVSDTYFCSEKNETLLNGFLSNDRENKHKKRRKK